MAKDNTALYPKKPPSDERAKLLNRLKRRLELIEENAKKATPGPWSISHSHVIKHEKRGDKVISFDIAARPWEQRMCVYGINPHDGTDWADMRFIATCEPKTMLSLVDDVRLILKELQQLNVALEESVKLQTHYAGILNQYDGGVRMQFYTVDSWVNRLTETGRLAKEESPNTTPTPTDGPPTFPMSGKNG